MRKLTPILFLLLLTVTATGFNFSIRDSGCQSDEVVLFSISNRTNAHAAAPDVYDDYTGTYGRDGKMVCAEGIGEAEIARECDMLLNPVISFWDHEDGRTHLSPKDERHEYILCAKNMATSVWKSCPGQSEPIVSIHDPIENHVAEPGYYKWQICGARFTNSTLAYNFTMSGNKDFILNGVRNATDNSTLNTDFPGYATVENDSLISGVVGSSTKPQQITIEKNGESAFTEITYGSTRGLMWFIPFTTGDMYDIENRLDMINNDNFLNQFNPNFAFNIAEKILVKVTLDLADIDIVSDLTLGTGFHNLVLRKEGINSKGKPEVSINASER